MARKVPEEASVYVRLVLTILRYISSSMQVYVYLRSMRKALTDSIESDLLFAILESGKFCFDLLESLFRGLS